MKIAAGKATSKSTHLAYAWDKLIKESSIEKQFLYPFVQILDNTYTTIRLEDNSKSSVTINNDVLASRIFNDIGKTILHFTLRSFLIGLRKTKGKTKAEQFNKYITYLENITIEELGTLYPVAKNILEKYIENYISAKKEMLERLNRDKNTLGSLLPAEQRYELIGIEPLGDTHNKGRQVTLLILHNYKTGIDYKLLYKPKTTKNNQALLSLVQWLNNKMDSSLSIPYAIENDTYSWEDYISGESCNSTDDVEKYYLELGIILALMYILSGRDIHHENIIANRHNPILIDIETLFTPLLQFKRFSQNNVPRNFAIYTSILPRAQKVSSDVNYIDISAFSGHGEQVHWRKTLETRCSGKKITVHFVNKKIKWNKNIPLLYNQYVNPFAYSKFLKKGFSTAYQLFLKEKDFLLSKKSPLSNFRHSNTRLILRSTSEYHDLLNKISRPSLLRNNNRFKKYLRNLLEKDGMINQIVDAELDSIMQNDIPFFSCNITKKTIDGGNQKRNIPGIINVTGYRQVIYDLKNQISMSDHNIQINAINQSIISREHSFLSFYKDKIKIDLELIENTIDDYSPYLIEHFICKLIDTHIINKNEIFWTCLKSIEGNHWAMTKSGYDYSSGLSGILFVISQINKLQQKKELESLKIKLSKAIVIHLTENYYKLTLGYLSGLSGILHALVQSEIDLNDEILPPIIQKINEGIVNKRYNIDQKNYHELTEYLTIICSYIKNDNQFTSN